METVLGFLGIIVIIMFIVAVVGDGGSAGTTSSTRPPAQQPRSTPPSRPVAPTPVQHTAHQREIERQQRADEAFFDGVVFSHFFLDQDDEAESVSVWDDGADDDLDDDGFYD